MRIYIAKRILYFTPAVFLVVLLSFTLLKFAPGDPTEYLLNEIDISGIEVHSNISNEFIKKDLKNKLGLNLPVLYFSISRLSEKENVNTANWKNYFPAINFHKQNQFHQWLFGNNYDSNGIFKGDFGNSWVTKEKVSSIISGRFKWSLFFSLISIFLAYLVSIPASIISVSYPNSKIDKVLSAIFIILFSLPAFWVASFLMLLFCNPAFINILPSSGIGPIGSFPEETGWIYKIIQTIPYLILPTICFTYSSFAFLSGSMKASLKDILKEDYIRTARAKGLKEKQVIGKHALRNALLPMITIFSHVFPFALGGSVILETIFTIPGMGLAIYQSISAQDYPVIIAVFLFTSLLTMLSFLLSDILYAVVDPRISLTGKIIK
jgi:peptide/nickel transport system permease protein